MLLREPLPQYVQRQVDAALRTRAGAVATYYAAAGLVYSVGAALAGGWHRCVQPCVCLPLLGRRWRHWFALCCHSCCVT